MDNGTNIRRALAKFAAQIGVSASSVLLPSCYRESEEAGGDDMSLILANIPLIDTSKSLSGSFFQLASPG
jgi:hypothetical protein